MWSLLISICLIFFNINAQDVETTIIPIECNHRYNGTYQFTLFMLNLSTPRLVTLDSCNSNFESDATIKLYPLGNDLNVLNGCGTDFEFACCPIDAPHQPLITDLRAGSYYFEFTPEEKNIASRSRQLIDDEIIIDTLMYDINIFCDTHSPTTDPTMQPTLNPLTVKTIHCNTVFNGTYYFEAILFQLNVSSSQQVIFDACDSELYPRISLHTSDNDTNILNQCDLDNSECCSETQNLFVTNLTSGNYYFELDFDERALQQIEYSIAVSCLNLEHVEIAKLMEITQTNIETSESVSVIRNESDSFEEEQVNNKEIAKWVYILIAIGGCCWITLLIVLVKRKRDAQWIRGLTIDSDDITSSEILDSDIEINHDQNDENEFKYNEQNEELQKFMDEDVVINQEHYDDIY